MTTTHATPFTARRAAFAAVAAVNFGVVGVNIAAGAAGIIAA